MELLLGDAERLEKRGNAEEAPEEGIPLHAQLQLRLAGGLAGDVEAGQDENADFVVADPLPVLRRHPLPGHRRGFVRLPDEAAALLQAFQRIGVREGLGIAAEHHVDMIELAVHLDLRRGDREVVVGGCALLFRPVLRVGHDVQLFDEETIGVVRRILLRNEGAEIADDRAQILARRDHAPTADRVKPHRDGPLGQKRRGVLADDGVGMVDTEHKERLAVARAGTVFAVRLADDKFVGAQRVFGAEVT